MLENQVLNSVTLVNKCKWQCAWCWQLTWITIMANLFSTTLLVFNSYLHRTSLISTEKKKNSRFLKCFQIKINFLFNVLKLNQTYKKALISVFKNVLKENYFLWRWTFLWSQAILLIRLCIDATFSCILLLRKFYSQPMCKIKTKERKMKVEEEK